MKEVIFQELIKREGKKRCLSIQETFSEGRYSYTSERKTIFKLKDIRPLDSLVVANEEPSRHLSLLRVCDERAGRTLWQSKAMGSIYVICGDVVLTVSFLQIFRIELSSKPNI